MKIGKLTLILLSGAALAASSAGALAMGMGGGGSGSMPSSSSPPQPQYDPAAEYQEGAAALEAGKYREAVTHFQRVTDATPKVAQVWLMLGMAKSGAGDEKGAERALERSVKLDDSSIDAHRQLALSLVKLKQPDKANAELAALQAKDSSCAGTCPDSANIKQAIAAVQQAMGAGASAAAPASTPPASATDPAAKPSADTAPPKPLSLAMPRQGDGAYVRAVSLINEQRFAEALVSLDKAEAAIGPHPDILTYKGYVWRRMGSWAKAEDYYRQALAIDPNHRGATEYYGELKVLKGDMAGARALLTRLDATCAFGCAEAEELRRWIDHRGDPAS
ncbi:MAG: tetratricopeptide repeat protein [Caulobacteraceae bacterium]|nr:tetratricopeptide repeat protein [Caulobacteraceae bacterium]